MTPAQFAKLALEKRMRADPNLPKRDVDDALRAIRKLYMRPLLDPEAAAFRRVQFEEVTTKEFFGRFKRKGENCRRRGTRRPGWPRR